MGGRGSAGGVAASAVNDVREENRIRAAYRDALGGRAPGTNVFIGLAAIRDRLSGMSREDQDAALRRLIRKSDHNDPGRFDILPAANRKGLSRRDHEAALHFAGEDFHAISFGNPKPQPLPKKGG